MSELRVGIMSFAHPHAQSYATLLKSSPGVNLVGFADDDDERAAENARRFDLARFASYDELLQQDLDAVIVCSENGRHYEHVELAAKAGAHVLCEKPLAVRLDDATAMVEVCHENDVLIRTAFPMRFSEPIREVKSLVTSGRVGHIGAIEGTNQGQIPLVQGGWFLDANAAGGGAVTDHAVHLVDLFRWLLSDEVVEVYAQANKLIGGEVEVETCGLLMLEFARGTVATIDCSWSRPRVFPTWGGLGMRLVASNAVVDVNAFAQRFASYDDTAGVSWIDWGDGANAGMLDEFLSACRTGDTPSSDPRDGVRAVAVVEAAYESIRTGRPTAPN